MEVLELVAPPGWSAKEDVKEEAERKEKNNTAVIVGVVVPLVVVSLCAGGVFMYLRRRRRMQAESTEARREKYVTSDSAPVSRTGSETAAGAVADPAVNRTSSSQEVDLAAFTVYDIDTNSEDQRAYHLCGQNAQELLGLVREHALSTNPAYVSSLRRGEVIHPGLPGVVRGASYVSLVYHDTSGGI